MSVQDALMTLKEYLTDHASPGTKAIGDKLIGKEVRNVPNEKARFYIIRVDDTMDGSLGTVDLEKRAEPHVISIQKTGITWLTLGQLIKADDPSPFPALTQIEVYGKEHGQQDYLK